MRTILCTIATLCLSLSTTTAVLAQSWVDVLTGTYPPIAQPVEPPPSPSPWTPAVTMAYCREVGSLGTRIEVALFAAKRSPVDIVDDELRRTPPAVMTPQIGPWSTLVRAMVFALHQKSSSTTSQPRPMLVKDTLEALCLKEPGHLTLALDYPNQIKWPYESMWAPRTP